MTFVCEHKLWGAVRELMFRSNYSRFTLQVLEGELATCLDREMKQIVLCVEKVGHLLRKPLSSLSISPFCLWIQVKQFAQLAI